MNKNVMIAGGLLLVVSLAWGRAFRASKQRMQKYSAQIETANDYASRALYEKAAKAYLEASKYKNTIEANQQALSSYEKAYLQKGAIYEEYRQAAETAVTNHPENADFLKKLVTLLVHEEEYSSAYRYLLKATGEAREDKEIIKLKKEVRYSFTLDWETYLDYRPLCNGYYAVSEDGSWNYLNPSGVAGKFKRLTLAGPVGEDGIRLIVNETKAMIVNEQEMPEGYLKETPEDAGTYSAGLMPVKLKGSYAYYNLLGDRQFGDYQEAGAFTGEKAAVKDKKGWFLIDRKGKAVSEKRYEDIRINPDGSYLSHGVMLAKEGGKYYLWNDKEEKISEEAFANVDVITADERIAVEKGGKWGFVDLRGKEILQPKYEEAKSFSCGLAGVKQNGEWGFIDSDGNMAIDPQFQGVDYFNKKGNCFVKKYDGWSFLMRNVKE